MIWVNSLVRGLIYAPMFQEIKEAVGIAFRKVDLRTSQEAPLHNFDTRKQTQIITINPSKIVRTWKLIIWKVGNQRNKDQMFLEIRNCIENKARVVSSVGRTKHVCCAHKTYRQGSGQIGRRSDLMPDNQSR